jgi:hypothetical protein
MKNVVDKKVLGYKIRNASTGLYAISISKNKWGKTGRTWSRMCDVIRVLNFGIKRAKSTYPGFHSSLDELTKDMLTWEIVELTEESSYSTTFLLDRLK